MFLYIVFFIISWYIALRDENIIIKFIYDIYIKFSFS